MALVMRRRHEENVLFIWAFSKQSSLTLIIFGSLSRQFALILQHLASIGAHRHIMFHSFSSVKLNFPVNSYDF
ncbi:hypothetical protein Fmac_009316 [Flemingia macrophylla]|uniref:Uncharacterized protein n=1 Tax=Flemingia macrophylla TaxID=520843 RepID=A0ABD1MZW6_9FABA